MQKKNTILIVDDDPNIRKLLPLILEDENFNIVECETGKDAVRLGVTAQPDLILLDLNLPDMDGLDVLRTLREWCKSPVIVLSGRSEDRDVIELLDEGADDFLIKPFNCDVLRARINASLRKTAGQETGAPELSNGPLRMDLVRHQVFLGDELIGLTPKEYKLLEFFISNCGKMLGHREILHEVWGPAHSECTSHLRVFVGQLRKKIEKHPAMPAIITTERRIGYRMEFIQDSKPDKQGELQI